MTASPELLHELRASRPVAPAPLRARTRELAAANVTQRSFPRLRLPGRRVALVLVPSAATLALVSAGVVGVARPGGQHTAVPIERANTPTRDAGGSSGQAAPSQDSGTSRQAAPPDLKTFAPSTGSGTGAL